MCFEATSLRSITAAADVNLAAANYHFGSKEELFHAVLTRRLDPMNQERLDLLTALEQTGWNISHTATRLGITRTTVYARMDLDVNVAEYRVQVLDGLPLADARVWIDSARDKAQKTNAQGMTTLVIPLGEHTLHVNHRAVPNRKPLDSFVRLLLKKSPKVGPVAEAVAAKRLAIR